MPSYGKLGIGFYDLDKPQAPPSVPAFYRWFAEQVGGPILEAMCGSGRYLLPLLEQGFEIEGLDASPDMLRACREKGRSRGLTPVLYQQYLHQLDLPRHYSLVIIPQGSFMLVTDPDRVRESLRRIFLAMAPGARFLLYVGQQALAESYSFPWGSRWIERPDGAKIIISWLGYYDAETRVQQNIHRYELIQDGRLLETEFEEYADRAYAPAEFRSLLEEAGFVQIEPHKAFDLCAPEEADEGILFECRKPDGREQNE